MVCFHHDHIAAAHVFADVLRGVTKIREKGQRLPRRKQIAVMTAREPETDRLLGIVGNGETLHFQITKAKTRTCLERLPIRPVRESGLDRAGRRRVGKDANMRVFFQPIDAARVITVFVREEDGIDAIQ